MKVRYNKLNVKPNSGFNAAQSDKAAAMTRLLAVLVTRDEADISLEDRADCLDTFIIEARKILGMAS